MLLSLLDPSNYTMKSSCSIKRSHLVKMRQRTFYVLLVCLFVYLTGCTFSAVKPQHPYHPLVGHIYQAEGNQLLGEEELLDRMLEADVIYLGERHDNANHHELQFDVLQKLVQRGKQPAIGFEIFSLEQTSILMGYSQFQGAAYGNEKYNAEDWLRNKMGLGQLSDRTWAYYGPIIELGNKHKLPVFGIDLNQPIRNRISKYGIAGLTNLERRLLYPTGFENDNYRAMMYEVFKQSHCGWGTPEYLSKLYDNWIARNDAMAMAITEMTANQEGPVVIIVGAGHTRFNMGVYDRVAALNPELKQFNLSFIGVREEWLNIDDYVQEYSFQDVNYGKDFEYIWLTKNIAQPEDYCKMFLKHKEKSEKHKATEPLKNTEKEQGEQATIEQAATEQATIEQATTEQATTEQATTEQATTAEKLPDEAAQSHITKPADGKASAKTLQEAVSVKPTKTENMPIDTVKPAENSSAGE